MSDTGGNFPLVDFGNVNLTLDDEATESLLDDTEIFAGTYKPTQGAPTANVRAAFSEDMQPSTINGTTFNFFKKGSTTKVGATVSYDATTDKATLDPTNSLKGAPPTRGW
jgi:hypothetical protein